MRNWWIWLGKGVVLVTVLTGCDAVTDLIANHFFLPNENVRSAMYEVTTERRVAMETRDDVTLRADVHHPDGIATTPTILVRIPFSLTFANRMRSDVIGRYWASRGYTVVIQGTRGRYESEGKFYPLRYEREDGLDTLQWLVGQPWYNGRLAMWGGSSFGHTQWAIADQINPGPDAYFVQIASTSFRDMFYPGQAFSLESAVYWTIRSRGDEDREVSMRDLEKGVQTLPLLQADDVAIGNTEFYNDWLIHKDDATYWNNIDGTHRAESLQAPMLLMGGWYDPFLPTQLEDFQRITQKAKPEVSAHSKLIIGPWGHATEVHVPGMTDSVPYRRGSLAPSVPWFDYHLGLSEVASLPAPVTLFVMGENIWREEQEWPLARAQNTSLFFHSHGKANASMDDGWLDWQPPRNSEPSDTYVYDPLDPVPTAGGPMLGGRSGIVLQNDIEGRTDVLVYTTVPMDEPVEVTGQVWGDLFITTDAPSTDFTVKLVDVHLDGSAYNVCDGIVRQSYDQTNQKATKPVKVTIDLWPTSHVFLAGHRIRVEISSSNFPRFARNLNTGEPFASATRAQPATQSIHHTDIFPSRILLPIIPR